MYAVTITDIKLGGTTVLGPFRTIGKAREIRDLCRNPNAVSYFGPEEYDVAAVRMRNYDGLYAGG
jgi:hypothetical protein